jgi:RNA polymerase sigma-70 factor (ECF subfamily)
VIPAHSGPRHDNACRPPQPTVDLASLLLRIAQRDEEALRTLYGATCRQVHTLALRILRDHQLAEEATADVYLQVWLRAKAFDPHRGDPRIWLMTMTRSRAIDRLRSRDADDSAGRNLLEEAWAVAPGPARHAEREVVQRALAELPVPQRHALELAYFQGLTQIEIATRLNEPLGTIKTRTRLALRRLRSILRDEEDR